MNETLLKQFTETTHSVCSLTPDYIMLTDTLSDELLNKLESLSTAVSKNLIVCIDHDTPNSTVAVGQKQRRLLTWAIDQKLTIEKCQGVGYLRLLENYIAHDQVVIGTGAHMAGFGAAGALGLTVTEDELLQAITGDAIELPRPAILTVSISGQLSETATIQDAARALQQTVQNQGKSSVLIALHDDTGLSAAQRYDLCHLLQEGGAVSALFTETAAAADLTFDLSTVQPLVVLPGEETKVTALSDVDAVMVNEVFIGGCRGGKLEDLRAAAAILKGKHIAYRLRLVVTPATSTIYLQALREGLIDIFLDAGAVVMNQGCSVCWGKAQGILDAGEVLVSTGSYHYPGCCGDPKASVYLVSPALAAQVALTGTLSK